MSDDTIVGIFRNRLREEGTEAYGPTADRMVELVERVPGFRGIKTFTADDGERVSIFEFESLEASDAWRADLEHQEAQRRGREEFYAEYELVVCRPIRRNRFPRD